MTIAASGTDGRYSVHVHTDDAGGAVEVGLGAGTITDWINALPQKLSDHGARV